jgi:hypothetical protein
MHKLKGDPISNYKNIYYLMILFRERGRKSAKAPGWLAFIDARFGVAVLEIQPSVAFADLRLRSCNLFIN